MPVKNPLIKVDAALINDGIAPITAVDKLANIPAILLPISIFPAIPSKKPFISQLIVSIILPIPFMIAGIAAPNFCPITVPIFAALAPFSFISSSKMEVIPKMLF